MGASISKIGSIVAPIMVGTSAGIVTYFGITSLLTVGILGLSIPVIAFGSAIVVGIVVTGVYYYTRDNG